MTDQVYKTIFAEKKRRRNYPMMLLSIGMQMSWYGGKRIPMLLEAPPGCGKTRAVNIIGALFDEHMKKTGLAEAYCTETFVLPQTMPESIEGIPSPRDDIKALIRYPLIGIRNLHQAKFGTFFGDEITSAPQQTGASVMTLIQDGIAGDTRLSETIAMVLACNPSDCAAAGRDLSPPEINRMCRIVWSLPLDDFLDFMEGGLGLGNHVLYLKPDWEKKWSAVARTLVVNFLKQNPKLQNQLSVSAHELKITEAAASEPWASERQWFNCMRMIAAILSTGEATNSKLIMLAVEGMLGEGVSKAFMAFLRDYNLPDPEMVIAEALKKNGKPLSMIPKEVMDRPDQLRLCLDSIAIAAQRAEEEDRAKRWEVVFDHVVHPIIEKKPDIAMSAARILAKDKPPGAKMPAAAADLFLARQKAGMARAGSVKK